MYMDSKDIVIVINGQEFVVEGSVLRPAGSNFQQEVLKRLDGIESRLGAVEQEQRILHVKVDGLQTGVYWTLAGIGIFLAALGIPAVIASVLSVFRRAEKQQDDRVNLTFSQVTELLLRGTAQPKETK